MIKDLKLLYSQNLKWIILDFLFPFVLSIVSIILLYCKIFNKEKYDRRWEKLYASEIIEAESLGIEVFYLLIIRWIKRKK